MFSKKKKKFEGENLKAESTKILKGVLSEIISKDSIQRMTPRKLKKFKGFEKISKKRAKEIINTLEMYCEIVIHHMKLKKDKL